MTKPINLRTSMMIILKYIMPFVLIMILSLIVGFFIYQRTSIVLENEVRNSNKVLLEQGMNMLDNRLQSVGEIIRKMMDDSMVRRLQHESNPFENGNLYRTIETRSRLQDYAISNELVLDYFIIYNKSGLVINNNFTGVLPNLSDTLSYLNEKGDFVNSLLEEFHYRNVIPERNVVFDGRFHSILTYLHSFGFSSYSNGTMLFLLDNNEIHNILRGINIEGGWAYIIDEKGRVLTSVKEDTGHPALDPINFLEAQEAIDGVLQDQNLIVTQVTSPYNNWTYVAVQPSEIVLEKILYIKKMTFTIFILFLLLVALIAIYFTYRNSKPVQVILKTISKYTLEPMKVSGNAMGNIQSALSNIIESNKELTNRMERQLPFLRASFFERLLRGQISSEGDMKAVMQHLRIKWEENGKVLVSLLTFHSDFKIKTEQDVVDLNEKKLIISDYIKCHIPDRLYLYEADDDQIALIFDIPLNNEEEVYDVVKEHLHAIQKGIENLYGIPTMITVGGLCNRWLDMSRSFLEAQQTLVRSEGSSILWYKDISINDENYIYPENMETRMIHLVRTGNREELLLLLDVLYKENFVNRELPIFMLTIFFYDFMGSVVKLSNETELDGFQLNATRSMLLESIAGIEAQFIILKDQLLEMCQKVRSTNETQQRKRFEEYLDFIDANYTDYQMSLTVLANQFQVSETYLSRSFKENTGFNFFECLENKRIEFSKQKLVETEMAVGDIALLIGYGSTNTFSRAFKRSVGISATEYRHKHNGGAYKK